jgi:hypothetical protein
MFLRGTAMIIVVIVIIAHPRRDGFESMRRLSCLDADRATRAELGMLPPMGSEGEPLNRG